MHFPQKSAAFLWTYLNFRALFHANRLYLMTIGLGTGPSRTKIGDSVSGVVEHMPFENFVDTEVVGN